MYKFFATAAALVGLGIAGSANAAVTLSDVGGTLAAFSYDVNDVTRTINIYETWDRGTTPIVDLLVEGWDYNYNSWTVNKYVTNDTGAAWDWFTHELLQSDLSQSPDNDGMSFAQHGRPMVLRDSDVYETVYADELSTEDWLKFYDGTVGNGETVWFTYGLTNRRDTSATNPFYLRQTAPSVPEPATWALLIAGFGMIGVSLRRRRRGLSSVTA